MTAPEDVTVYRRHDRAPLVGPLARLTSDEYDRAQVHDAAGPVGDLLLQRTRDRFRAAGATHWRLRFETGTGTVLEPCTVEGDGEGAGADR